MNSLMPAFARTLGTAVIAAMLTACAGGASQLPRAAVPSGSVVSSSASASSNAPGTLQSLIDNARKEGELDLVWGENAYGGGQAVQEDTAGFNKQYGLQLKVNFTPGPSMPEMGTKILQEFQTKRPATSDIMLGPESVMLPLIRAGALQPVNWSTWASNIKDPNLLGVPTGEAVEFTSGTPVITYNSQALTGNAIPKSLKDLLQARFKGRIATTPYAAIFDRLATSELWGKEQTVSYVTQLAGQAAGLIRCGETNRVASGEFDAFALDCQDSNARLAQAKGAPIAWSIPSDAPLLLFWYMGVPKNAAHPNAAQLWVNYMLGRSAQDVMFKDAFTDDYRLPGSHSQADIQKLKDSGIAFHELNIAFDERNDPATITDNGKQLQGILSHAH